MNANRRRQEDSICPECGGLNLPGQSVHEECACKFCGEKNLQVVGPPNNPSLMCFNCGEVQPRKDPESPNEFERVTLINKTPKKGV